MIRKIYLVARTLLATPTAQGALAVGVTGYGIAKLTQLAKEREDVLSALNGAIGDRRRELARVTAVLREANASAAAVDASYPSTDDVDPLHRAEPEPEPAEPAEA